MSTPPKAKAKVPAGTPVDPQPPEEDDSLIGMLKREWPQVRRFLFHGGCVVFGALVVMFLYDKFVIPAKEAELGQKGETIRTISEERDREIRENEKLRKQVEDLRIYRGQDAPPLKRKALILAQQIRDFTKNWKDTDSPDVQQTNVSRYLDRFGLRALIIRDDLDQNGKQSDAFDNLMHSFSNDYKGVRSIADEVEKLAKTLPD